MTNPKRLICNCSQTNKTVNEYFNRACQSSQDRLLPIQGEMIKGDERLLAQFFLDIQDFTIKTVSYKCTTCVSLVVYCERLRERVFGLALKEVMSISSSDLVLTFPEVPIYKRNRAILAVQALRSAVYAATSYLPNRYKNLSAEK